MKSKNMPKYKNRNRYLLNLKKKNLRKCLQAILFIHHSKFMGDNFLSLSDVLNINNILTDDPDNDEIKIVYFCKTYQRLFDKDDQLRVLLHNVKEMMPNKEEKIKFRISNKIGDKIKKFLNWSYIGYEFSSFLILQH